MSNYGAGPGDVFDVRKIRRLVELMNEHDLAEIDLRQADQRIRLRRGPLPPSAPGLYPMAAPAQSAPPLSDGARPSGSSGQSKDDAHTTLIRSPMVGTFYTAPSPDSAPFVKAGDRIGPETTVCVVEAMKVFNEIPAEISGQIVAVLAENGEPVEYGQPLFKVDKGA